MAQSLESRINAALRSAARLKDVEGVIADVEAEIAATQVKLEAENARSIDPALTTPQAREARNNAADLEHDIRRLDASLGLLTETRDKIVKTTAEDQRRIRYDAAQAERDDLARHIRSRYPEIGMELLNLVKRIQASDAECERVNRDTPTGAAKLVTAEHVARDTGFYWDMQKGGGPVMYLSQMTLPLLSREGVYLPIQSNDISGSTSWWSRGIEADSAFAKVPIEGIKPAPVATAQKPKAA